MEFIGNEKPEMVEVHVKMTRTELIKVLSDIESGEACTDPYAATKDFMDYLKGL